MNMGMDKKVTDKQHMDGVIVPQMSILAFRYHILNTQAISVDKCTRKYNKIYTKFYQSKKRKYGIFFSLFRRMNKNLYARVDEALDDYEKMVENEEKNIKKTMKLFDGNPFIFITSHLLEEQSDLKIGSLKDLRL